jgi:fumarylacetoacetase
MTGYGVFVHKGQPARIGYRVGDAVLDLTGAEAAGRIDAGGAFQTADLTAFLALGRPAWTRVGAALAGIPGEAHSEGWPMVPLDEVALLLPFAVADYVDFYSSQHHAGNVGQIFRPGEPALTPNWKHLPIGYHGRAGTVVVSGTDIVRPSGQRKADDVGPSARLDIEAEVGFVVGPPSELGTSVHTADFERHVFGVVLVNDWSARDLQAWEYRPLGPLLGKSFATSISPWVVPLDALARVPAPTQDPPVVEYLREAHRFSYDIELAVTWNDTLVSRPPFQTLYWTPAQQLAHLTANGASLRTGDLFASGTVSGPRRDQTGSFLELTWGGTEPIQLADGSARGFLLDGDTVRISATAAAAGGGRIELGEVTGRVCPARDPHPGSTSG